MPVAIKPLIIFRPIVPFNHKAERTEMNHFFSHTLQNQLPRTRHEASAADTMHLDRRGWVKLRTTHRRNHCTQSMPVAIKPLHNLPSHSSIQPQGRKDRDEPFFQPHVAEFTTTENHEASAADTMHSDRHGWFNPRMTHRTPWGVRERCARRGFATIFSATYCRIHYQGQSTKPVLPTPCIRTATDDSLAAWHTARATLPRSDPLLLNQWRSFPPILPFIHRAEGPRQTIFSGQTGPYHIVRHALLPRFDLYLNQPS